MTQAGNQPEATRYFHDLLGRPDRTELPNGVVEDYTFDALGGLQKVAQYKADADNTNLADNPRLAEFTYTLRADDKRTGLTEKVWFDDDGNPATPAVPRTVTYAWSYDNAGRLLSETIDHFDNALDRTETFTRDLVNDRVKRTVDLAATPGVIDQVFTSRYDANDRLLEETLDLGNDGSIDQRTAYDWGVTAADPDGVTQQFGKTVRNAAGVTASRQLMAYNLQGQLASVVNESFDGAGALTGRSRTAYQYDVGGIRTVATEAVDANLDNIFTAGETTRSTEYLIDHHGPTGLPQTVTETEKNAAGQPVRRVSYAFGGDEVTQTVTQLDPSSGAVVSTATHTFAHDGHGSVRLLVGAAAAALLLFGSGAAVADAGKKPAKEGSSFGSLRPPDPAEVRWQAEAWLRSAQADAATLARFKAVWEADRPLLDKVASALTLGDPKAAKLLADARDPDAPAPVEVPAILKDRSKPELYRANLALAYAKALAGRKVYEEALTALASVKPEEVVDPAAYYFHKAVCEHALMLKDKADQSIDRLLVDVVESPERYRMVAALMHFDMLTWQDKDLGWIARKMGNIQRRLDLQRGGKQTQKQQKEVLVRLDEMIKEMENQQKKGGS